MPRGTWATALTLTLCACWTDGVASSDDELGGSSTDAASTSESDTSTTDGTSTSDDTSTSSTSDTSTTDDTSSTSDTSTTDDTTDAATDDATDTGWDTGFLDGDPLCPSANWAGDEVVATRAHNYGPEAVLSFVRADGSSFVVREDPEVSYFASATGDHVVVTRESDCAWSSYASLYLRETGELVWDDVLLPSAGRQARVRPDGRVIFRGGRCEVPEPFFAVVDAGELLDAGEGDARGLRDDDWLGIYRPLYERDVEPGEHYRWRNVVDDIEIGPSFPLASPAEFLGGRLVYASVLEGGFMLVIEAPTSEPIFVDHPAFGLLESTGWTFSLAFDDPWSTSARTLVLATSPEAEHRLFVMLGDDVITELPLTPPPGTYGLAQPEPVLDANDNPLLTWRTADSAWLWRGVDESWTAIGPELTGFDRSYAREIADTVRIEIVETELDIEVWQPNPNALSGSQTLYVRGPSTLVVPLDTMVEAQSPTGHCVALSKGSSSWLIHDIETNQTIALPDPPLSTFAWLD